MVLDTIVGAGNSARLVGNTKTTWNSTTSSVNVDLNGYEFDIDTGNGNAQTYNGAITGPGTLRIVGAWNAGATTDARLGGTVANSPDSVLITQGLLRLNKTAGVNAVAGPITVNSTAANSARIQLQKSEQISDASTITSIDSSGAFTLELGGFTETISGLEIKTGHTVHTGTGGILKVTTLKVGGDIMPTAAYTASSAFVTGTGWIEVNGSGPPVIVTLPAAPATPNPADTGSAHPVVLRNSIGPIVWMPPPTMSIWCRRRIRIRYRGRPHRPQATSASANTRSAAR